MFYNTINEVSSTLVKSHLTTRTQEAIILDCFKSAKEPLSPSMVHFLTKLKCPITSIRRAMTNLAKSGKLKKTSKYTIGKFGKKEHLWIRNSRPTLKETQAMQAKQRMTEPGDFRMEGNTLCL